VKWNDYLHIAGIAVVAAVASAVGGVLRLAAIGVDETLGFVERASGLRRK
jgi:hypothetical protein